jgi:hypothetical protein
MKSPLVVLLLALTVSVGAQAETIEDIKTSITTLSMANMANEANRVEIRTELEHLTTKLQKLAGPVTEANVVQHAPGSWQQIWSDEPDMTPPGAPKLDVTQVYQVVSPELWAYNFGVRKINENVSVTFALEVAATVSGDQQTTEITKAYMRNTPLQKGEDIGLLAQGIWNKSNVDFAERNAGRFPNGPIGAKGILTILFVDKDLKIGRTPNVYDANRVDFFVMERTATVR